MPLDIAELRAATPGCELVTHLNNAGASLQPAVVANAVRSYLDDEVFGGGYETADARRSEIDDFYPAVAHLIGAQPNEVAFLDSATRAWQMIFYSLELSAGDQILTTTTEYHSNYVAYLHLAQRRGVEITVVPDSDAGEIDVARLADLIGSSTKLISLNHMPTNSGVVNPAGEVGVVARGAGIPFLLDACQSVGHTPIDVETIGCDFLTATGRKYMRGPRGTGFLYVSQRHLAAIHPVIVDGHAAPWTADEAYVLQPDGRRFEVWEQNVAGKVGLATAARYAVEVGVEETWQRIQSLAAKLRSQLSELSPVTVRDRGRVQSGIVSFTVDGLDSSEVVAGLRDRRINTSSSTVSSARIDMSNRDLEAVVRASVHYFNTEGEISHLVDAVAGLSGA